MTALLALNLALAGAGYRLGTVGPGGAIAGGAVGAAVALALAWPGYGLLLVFFVVGSGATRIGRTRKDALGIAEPRAGARGARQVVANGGPPALFGALAATAPGAAGEILLCAFAGSLAAAAADTASSEVGKAFGGPARRLTDFARMPAGTTGAVTPVGTLAGLGAALALGGAAAWFGLVPAGPGVLAAAGGFAAALGEGLLAPLERRGVLTGDGVNAVAGLAGGVLAGLGCGLRGAAATAASSPSLPPC